ncbi:hypothetical protein BG004_003583 [Podila humilis]|nr:hypothetical protein BG004_003583 [Podila humilis]
MRFSIVAVIATVAAVASAQATNPAYPFTEDGPCVKSCLLEAGKSLYPEYTDDPAAPNFLESMAYGHERGTPKYTAFMTKSGTCMSKCPKTEQDLYNSQFSAKANWFTEKKAAATPSSPSSANTKTVTGLVGSAALLCAVALF